MAKNHSNRASDGRRAKHRQSKAGYSAQEELRFLNAQAELNAPKAIQVWRPQRNSITCMDALRYLWQVESDSVDMILADLPYGSLEHIGWDSIIPFEPMWGEFKRILKQRSIIALTASQPFTSYLLCSNPQWFRCEWIWRKSQGTGYLNANRQPMKNHESVLIFSRGEHRYYPVMREGEPYSATSGAVGGFVRDKTVGGYVTINLGFRYPLTVIEFDSETGYHPTQKPVALFEYLIKTYTQPGDVVLDPTCGSGTTAVAALRTGRQYLCNDIMPEYVAIAQQRARYWYKDIKLGKTDAYQHKTVADGVQQLSLFAEAG